jgi:hypothetical protein
MAAVPPTVVFWGAGAGVPVEGFGVEWIGTVFCGVVYEGLGSTLRMLVGDDCC